MIYLANRYASVLGGKEYRLLERGRDYYAIRVRGKKVYVPSFAFSGLNNEENE